MVGGLVAEVLLGIGELVLGGVGERGVVRGVLVEEVEREGAADVKRGVLAEDGNARLLISVHLSWRRSKASSGGFVELLPASMWGE